MKALQRRVDQAFIDYAKNQRKLLSKKTGAPENIFSFPIMTLIITNKLKGKRTKLKINKRSVIIE